MVQHAKCCSYRISNGHICGATHIPINFIFFFVPSFSFFAAVGLLLLLFVVDIWYGHKSLLTVTILLTPVKQIFAIWMQTLTNVKANMKCGPTCKAHFNTNSYIQSAICDKHKKIHMCSNNFLLTDVFHFKILFRFWFWLLF